MDTAIATAPPRTVVVAIDGSTQSRSALVWAAAYARTTGVALHAVHVLRYDFGVPASYAPGLRGSPHTVSGPELNFVREDVQQLFDEYQPESTWTLTFRNGIPGVEIVRFSAAAALLVVGTREHQGIERLLAGSVSHYCLNHTVCPVVAVPPAPPRDSGDDGSGHDFTWVDDHEKVEA